MIDDLEIPMHLEDDEALREEKRKRNEHWARMRKARDYWINELSGSIPDENFWLWLRDDYGIVPSRDEQGNLRSSIDIVDEKLYILFLLKFGQ